MEIQINSESSKNELISFSYIPFFCCMTFGFNFLTIQGNFWVSKKCFKNWAPKNILFQLIYCMCFCASVRVAFPVEKKSLRRKIFVRELCKLYLVQEEKYFKSTLQWCTFIWRLARLLGCKCLVSNSLMQMKIFVTFNLKYCLLRTCNY